MRTWFTDTYMMTGSEPEIEEINSVVPSLTGAQNVPYLLQNFTPTKVL
jgi:hypothetical protein